MRTGRPLNGGKTLNLSDNIDADALISNEEVHIGGRRGLLKVGWDAHKKAAAADTPLYTCRSLSPDGRISLTSGRLSFFFF
jgi:hypothetical protein